MLAGMKFYQLKLFCTKIFRDFLENYIDVLKILSVQPKIEINKIKGLKASLFPLDMRPEAKRPLELDIEQVVHLSSQGDQERELGQVNDYISNACHALQKV
jgi:hypothetical protein